MNPAIEFCGETAPVDHQPFTIGRDADFVLDDDNRHLHRQFLSLDEHQGVWLLSNVGGVLTATVADADSRLEAFLAPGAVLPLVFDATVVRFTAGPTTYEFTITLPDAVFVSNSRRFGSLDRADHGDTTVGRVAMTPEQLRLIVAIAEPALRGDGRSAGNLPSNQEVARRLGWRLTRVNRKLDNVCQKLAGQGIRGLHGAPGQLASNRRARLVEYAMAVRMVTRDDLALLDLPNTESDVESEAEAEADGDD